MPTSLTWITDQLATGGVAGTVHPSRLLARMRRERVDLVIDCRAEVDDRAAWDGAPVEHLWLPVFDVPAWGMPPEHFDRAIDTAGPVLARGGRVFVHCYLGHNRGPSTALALLLDAGLDFDAARGLIRKRRPAATLAHALDAYDAHVTRGTPARRRLHRAFDLPHDHYGDHGAAGLLLVDTRRGRRRVLLQQRSAHVAAPGTWSIPGGALAPGETPAEAALRELGEELGIGAERVHLEGRHTAARCPRSACGGWTYTTLVARLAPVPRVLGGGWETAAAGWVDVAEVAHLDDLHPWFAAAWPALRRRVAQLV